MNWSEWRKQRNLEKLRCSEDIDVRESGSGMRCEHTGLSVRGRVGALEVMGWEG